MRLKEAKSAISNFKKLTGDDFKTLNLTLNTYGDINENFYDSLENAYESVVNQCCVREDYYKSLADRLEEAVHNTDGIGWGFHDGLCELYYSLRWLEN